MVMEAEADTEAAVADVELAAGILAASDIVEGVADVQAVVAEDMAPAGHAAVLSAIPSVVEHPVLARPDTHPVEETGPALGFGPQEAEGEVAQCTFFCPSSSKR